MPEDAGIATDQELPSLPRWAVIAYAARGVRRALPAFAARWPDAGAERVQVLTDAIELIERACAAPGAVTFEQLHAAGNAVMDVSMAAAAAAHAGAEDQPDERIFAAAQLARAVSSAASGAKSATAGDDRFAAGLAADAVGFADLALQSPAFAAVARRDFEALQAKSRSDNWDAESAVDVAALGAEWPDGAPDGWPG